jgi:hypothetical protein
MQVLVPQLPGRLRRRLGYEAGANVGFISFKVALPGEVQQQSAVAALDAIVRMIEKGSSVRRRTDVGLAPGDWIQFDEEFRYGDDSTWQSVEEQAESTVPTLVYFIAVEPPPLVLCGSAAHVLDRRQPQDRSAPPGASPYYASTFMYYVRELVKSTNEAALGSPEPLPENYLSAIGWGVDTIWRSMQHVPGWSGAVRLAGHARVLAVEANPYEGGMCILATPLYVEYSISR